MDGMRFRRSLIVLRGFVSSTVWVRSVVLMGVVVSVESVVLVRVVCRAGSVRIIVWWIVLVSSVGLMVVVDLVVPVFRDRFVSVLDSVKGAVAF